MGRGTNLGDLEELILLCVRRLGEGADGASVRTELSTVAGRDVSVSTVYVTLMRLEEKGLIRSWMGEPSAERGGKARRLFDLRPEGARAVEERRAVRERLWTRGTTADPERSGA